MAILTVDFTWDPNGPFSYVVNGKSYGAGTYGAPAFVPVTLTANVTLATDDPVTIVRWLWDFGDGTFGSGPEVVHTWKIANPYLRCRLKAIDSDGDEHRVGHYMNLTGELEEPVFNLFAAFFFEPIDPLVADFDFGYPVGNS